MMTKSGFGEASTDGKLEGDSARMKVLWRWGEKGGTMNLHGRRYGTSEGIDLVEPRYLAGRKGGGHLNTADRQEQVL